MSYVNTKSRFHVALNGVGLLLQGAPNHPAYAQSQAPVYGTRFASGDRDYNDLSQWWYHVQTSWVGGLKDTPSWADDARYYLSSNIDSWSESGSIKLTRAPVLYETFTENVLCGIEAEVAAATFYYIGTDDDATAKPVIYKYNGAAFVNISSTQMSTNQNAISQLSGHASILWTSTVGVGFTNVVLTYNGTTFTDQSSLISTLTTYQPMSSRCHAHYNGITYVFVENSNNSQYALVKTSQINPSLAAHWSLVFEKLNSSGFVVDANVYNGKLYYLVNRYTSVDLHSWDIANSVDNLVQSFTNTSIQNYAMGGGKLLSILNGKLIITIPSNEIWELDGTTLTRIFLRDEFKRSLNGEMYPYLLYGAIISDNKAWWGNLMYDGVTFHNTFKDSTDSTASSIYNLFVDANGYHVLTDNVNTKKLFRLNPVGTTYKGTADKNYIILNNFDKVSGVDKLAYSTTILFKPLVTGQKISVEYLLGELSTGATWTALGNANYTDDGGVVTSKTLFFGSAVVFNKMWFRIKLEGGGTNTPTMTDIVTAYLPVPTYKKAWVLRANCADELKRLDGSMVETTARELRGSLENAWWTKSLMDYQDLDYATSALNMGSPLGSAATTITVLDTQDFPEQGRIKIEDEEIFYTSKNNTQFLGCTRGVRGTRAASHADTTVVNNAYKVLITKLGVSAPILLEDKELEYIVELELREV